MARRDRKLNKEIRDIKESTPCARCNNLFPYYCVDFDHLPGKEKLGNINRLMWSASREIVMNEIAKTQVLCKMCHATVEHIRRNNK